MGIKTGRRANLHEEAIQERVDSLGGIEKKGLKRGLYRKRDLILEAQ